MGAHNHPKKGGGTNRVVSFQRGDNALTGEFGGSGGSVGKGPVNGKGGDHWEQR